MAKSTVYISRVKPNETSNRPAKVARLFDKAGFASMFKSRDLVAVKLHIGEPGNTSFIPPALVKPVTGKIAAGGGNPFLTDSNTLYHHRRHNAVDHMRSAAGNGFNLITTGAPFIVADGLKGDDFASVPINGEHLKEAKVGSVVYHADALVALSHFKGHILAGFGGTFKNIGMGCAARLGKYAQHVTLKPKINESVCTACGECVLVCPAEAISIEPGQKAHIDTGKCIGCGECVVTCKFGAIPVQWAEGAEGSMQERMVEYTMATLQNKKDKCAFINYLINITPECDCMGKSDPVIVDDIGFLASRDPLALEKASVDLVNEAEWAGHYRENRGKNKQDKFVTIGHVDWRYQIEHAKKLGLGSVEYELAEV